MNTSSTITNIAPNASNTSNISAASATNVNANINNTVSEPDTVSVDGPTKMPVVNSTSIADDGQSVDESERYVQIGYLTLLLLFRENRKKSKEERKIWRIRIWCRLAKLGNEKKEEKRALAKVHQKSRDNHQWNFLIQANTRKLQHLSISFEYLANESISCVKWHSIKWMRKKKQKAICSYSVHKTLSRFI